MLDQPAAAEGCRPLERKGSPKAFLLTCGSIGAAALLRRIVYVLVVEPRWDPAVRQDLFLRMDTLMIGGLLGGLRVYNRPGYDRFAQNRRILDLLGLGGLSIATARLFVGIRNLTVNASFLMRTVFFDLLAISVALMILALESSPAVNERWASRWWAGAVRYVSLSSYSLYLIHLSAFEPLLAINSRQRSVSQSVAWMVAAVAVSLALAGAMYRWFEKPMLRIRDRLAAPVFIERTPASDPSGSEGERS